MKTSLAVVLAIVGLMILGIVGGYNSQIVKDEACNKAQANLESAYQRRFDLIPNLVKTVKAYAEHEKATLEAVTLARQNVQNIKLENSVEGIEKFEQAQSQMSSALSRLMVVVEKYPDLKANQNFLDLQHQLEGTENRINVARIEFNDSVSNLNSSVKSFFGRMISVFTGVKTRESFKSQAGAEKAPEVAF